MKWVTSEEKCNPIFHYLQRYFKILLSRLASSTCVAFSSSFRSFAVLTIYACPILGARLLARRSFLMAFFALSFFYRMLMTKAFTLRTVASFELWWLLNIR